MTHVKICAAVGHTEQQILQPHAKVPGEVDSWLVGCDHSRHERDPVVGVKALRSFVDIEKAAILERGVGRFIGYTLGYQRR